MLFFNLKKNEGTHNHLISILFSSINTRFYFLLFSNKNELLQHFQHSLRGAAAFNLCMEVFFLSHELSDLCLGKPPLKSLSTSATVAEAIEVLRSSGGDSFVSVWNCDHSEFGQCQCVGKICMVDVIVFLCKPENLLCPSKALKASISNVLNKVDGLVVHLEPSSRYHFFLIIN